MATNPAYPIYAIPYQYNDTVRKGGVCATICWVLVTLVILSVTGGLFWWFLTIKEAVTTTVDVKGFIVSNDALKDVIAVPSEIPANCSGSRCNVALVTPVDAVTKSSTGATSAIHTDAPQDRCTQLKGYRLPGAGYKTGAIDDQIQPGYGTVVEDLDTCNAACAADSECVQYTFDIAKKNCYKMNKKYPYTSEDVNIAWNSGVC